MTYNVIHAIGMQKYCLFLKVFKVFKKRYVRDLLSALVEGVYPVYMSRYFKYCLILMKFVRFKKTGRC